MNDMHSLTIPSGLLLNAGFSPSFVAHCSLFIGIVLLWTIVIGKCLKKICGLPAIAGHIIAGIALGPSLLDMCSFSVFAQPLQLFDHASGMLYTLLSSDLILCALFLISSVFTVSYLLWIAGHETDLRDMVSVGAIAVGAGVCGAVLPIGMIAAFLYWCTGSTAYTAAQSVGMGLIFAATSVSIPVAMLFSYNKMHLKSSKAALGAAIVDDVVAVIALSLFALTANIYAVSISSALSALFVAFLVMICVGYWILVPSIAWLKRTSYAYLMTSAAMICMFFYSAFAEMVGGLAGITGAYFAGLFHRMGDHKHTALKVIVPFVDAILLPLFLGSIGLQVNIRLLHATDWIIVTALLIIAIVSKLLACWLVTVWNKQWKLLDIYLFGSSMVARGEVGLIVSTILLSSGIITAHHYVIAIVVIVLTTVATPIMLAYGFKHIALIEQEQAYTLNCGLFPLIGVKHIFSVIAQWLQAHKMYAVTIDQEHNYLHVNVDGTIIKIALNPQKGIIFEGDRKKIETIVSMIKDDIIADLESFGAV